MSGVDVVPARHDGDTPATPRCDTCLGPECDFPSELSALPLVELQVLHSRVVCQLEREYLADPGGPHPVTQDRHEELVAELEAREGTTDGR